MRKRVCAVAAVLVLMLSMTVQAAEPRAIQPRCFAEFQRNHSNLYHNCSGR